MKTPKDTVTLTRELLQAFGKPDAIAALLDENVVWTLPESLSVVGGTWEGKDAVVGLMGRIFGEIYRPESVKVTIADAFADGNRGAGRFHLKAEATFGVSYQNEYSIFIETAEGKIKRVWEYMDTQFANNQFTGATG